MNGQDKTSRFRSLALGAVAAGEVEVRCPQHRRRSAPLLVFLFVTRDGFVLTGGETLGEGLLEWGRETFGLTINEFYGQVKQQRLLTATLIMQCQTECNLVLGNCASILPVRPGSMGRPIPGHVSSSSCFAAAGQFFEPSKHERCSTTCLLALRRLWRSWMKTARC